MMIFVVMDYPTLYAGRMKIQVLTSCSSVAGGRPNLPRWEFFHHYGIGGLQPHEP